MKRLHLIEIQNEDWCPRSIRDAGTDYLQFVIAKTKPYAAIVPILTSALAWTYLIPVMPLLAMFDGMVSSLRTYSVEELRRLTEGLQAQNYQWDIGTVKSTAGPIPVTYLVRMPIHPAATQ
jgi:hypothetical protein